jgi:hypothetical protein
MLSVQHITSTGSLVFAIKLEDEENFCAATHYVVIL